MYSLNIPEEFDASRADESDGIPQGTTAISIEQGEGVHDSVTRKTITTNIELMHTCNI